MPTIQIDMFEVQLGAAMLLQFEVGEAKTQVRVLADAGVRHKDYDTDHVLKKLKLMLPANPRIDLVIGTHYDEDHLNGLVPIIEDREFSIGEAWMPPVIDDTQQFAVDRPLALNELLTMRLAREDGDDVLLRYLEAKRREIAEIDSIKSVSAERDEMSATIGMPDEFAPTRKSIEINGPVSIEQYDRYFRSQLAEDGSDEGMDHGCEQEVEPVPMVEVLKRDLQFGGSSFLPMHDQDEQKEMLRSRRSHNPRSFDAQVRTLTNLKKQVAKEAINATALRKVLAALGRRSITVRSEIINDGIPRRYQWNPAEQRFLPVHSDSNGLTFDLLGPSVSLVKKHRDRLPVLESIQIALAFTGELRSITPSNQLSYIGCFRYAGQSVLVSGDAGCVDFKAKKRKYFPKLLEALKPLHVVQVAHHGGANAHFYRVLAAAGYLNQTERSWLLLSHATYDRKRPSDAFRDFLLSSPTAIGNVRLLFTSEPSRNRVAAYFKAINPIVGKRGKEGDVRLEYDDDWKVTAHAIGI